MQNSLTKFNFLSEKVCGGIASGETVKEAVIKECEEEANLHSHFFDLMKPAGCVRSVNFSKIIRKLFKSNNKFMRSNNEP